MMRYIFFLGFVIMMATHAWSQKMPEDYFEEARTKQFKKKYTEALLDYSYIVKHYAKSQYCSSAYYHMGDIYETQGKEKLAIDAFMASVFCCKGKNPNLRSVVSAYDDQVMAAERLSNLYEKGSMYDSAIYFHYLYDTGFEKFYGCGLAAKGAQVEIVARYAELYVKANQIKEAEIALLSMHVFGWGRCDGTVSTKLKSLLQKHEDAAALKSQLDSAINHYFIDTVHKNYDGVQYDLVDCCLYFLGAKVRFVYSGMTAGDGTFDTYRQSGLRERDKIIAHLKKSELYCLVQQL